jgi:hypothetical protein
LSKEGRDFLFNKLLNTDPTKRLNIHEKNDYLGLEQSTPKPKFNESTVTVLIKQSDIDNEKYHVRSEVFKR